MIRLPVPLACALVLLLVGCASPRPLPPPPVHANGGALWRIVDTQCLPGQRDRGDPAPCAVVAADQGFVVLKDRVGASQYLVMPSARITGIEDPKILAPDAPALFSAAWDARRLVAQRLGRPLPRDATSVAVNSLYGRSQDQLHLHVDCLSVAAHGALQRAASGIGSRWSRLRPRLAGHAYYARRLDGETLTRDPFRLLADDMPGAARDMGAWTLVLVGAASPSGAPAFYLLADRADPRTGDPASGEELQDHSCAIAAAAP